MYALTRFSLDHTRFSAALLLAVTALLAAGLPRLQHAYGYSAIIGSDHPVIQTLEEMVEQFGGGIPARIRWECGDGLPCGRVFDRASLEMAARVTSQLSAANGVRKVYGVANSGLLVAAPDGFSVRRLVERGVPAPDAEELARLATDDPMWANMLLSRDLRVGSLFVVPDRTDHRTELAVVAAIERALAPFRAQGFEFHVAGGPVDGVVAGRDLSESTSRVIPLTVLLIAVILLLLSRSWQDTLASLAAMGTALLWTYGTLAWLDWPLDGILEVLAPLIMVVGICDAVHLLSRQAERRAEDGLDGASAQRVRLLEVVREVGGPCLITTVTTAAAFLSFASSNLASFQRFGPIAAFGVVACLLLSFSLLPILTVWLPQPEGSGALRTQRAWNAALSRLIDLAERRTSAVLLLSSALLVVGGFGWYAHLRVDTNWNESVGENSSHVLARKFEQRHHFIGDSLEIEVTLPRDTPVESPAALARIEAFENAAARHPLVIETRSLLALIRQLNRLLHDDDPSYQRVGDSPAANAEILELIAFDDPDMLGIWLNLDRTRLRITLHNREVSAQEAGELLHSIRELAREHLGPGWAIRMSGSTAIDYEWTNDVQQTQVRSFPIALALVFTILAVFMRSARLACAAMVPAVLPIVVTLGAMGWAGMDLDMGRAMIAAILLGIAVDDSIHILHRYQLRRRAGDDPAAAIRAAVLYVGRAIVTTSLSLSLGFLTLTASAWQSISSFGMIVSGSILAALAAALLVLPALVIAFSPIAAKRPLRGLAERPEPRVHRSATTDGRLNAKRRLDPA